MPAAPTPDRVSARKERYLVTGGAGFIGSHLTELLLANGHSVIALDNLSTGRLNNLDRAGQSPDFRFVHGSVMDEVLVDELVHQSDVVVHLAAAVGVNLILDEPLRSFHTNVRGTEVVMEASHRYRRKVLIASTSEIYGKNGGDLLSEESDRVLGSPKTLRWAYSTAKAVDEILAYLYHLERGLPTIVCRFFNTVGPRQSPSYGMVIPRLVRQALRDEPITVYGNGLQTRCFCHVYDVTQAIYSLLQDERAIGDVFNVGSSQEISILALAHKIIGLTDSSSRIDLIPYEQAFTRPGYEDMKRRVPDVSKLSSLIGWQPAMSLDTVLHEVIEESRLELMSDARNELSIQRS
jgi:UDP-glucose 4-epimerase